ncbi:hypothetical protein appser2_20870 [Actinobacillus pleuropneumoniae serovar 2 str. S1536]|nr:hypothetical protein appser2_20870 [Actinobacillus pleuropneumoniae serovar 2 str. S1536]
MLTFGTNFPNSLASKLKQGKLSSKVYAIASAENRGTKQHSNFAKNGIKMTACKSDFISGHL